jgi:endonuclease G, mitochondrial
MLRTLQITALVLGAAAVILGAVAAPSHPLSVFAPAVAAALAYFSFLWNVLRPNSAGFLQELFRLTFRFALGSTPRASLACLALTGACLITGLDLLRRQREANFAVYIVEEGRGRAGVQVVVTDVLTNTRLGEQTTDAQGWARFRLSTVRHCQLALTRTINSATQLVLLAPQEIKDLPHVTKQDLAEIAADHWTTIETAAVGEEVSARASQIRTVSRRELLHIRAGPILGDPVHLPTHLPWGAPAAPKLLSRKEYVVGFDPSIKLARWVAYRTRWARQERQRDRFLPDPLLDAEEQASPAVYGGNQYDRGQLVRRSDIAGHGPVHEVAFYMSIVAPQIDMLNRSTWLRLEEYSTQLATAENRPVWILAGPVLQRKHTGESVQLTYLGGQVPVPAAFYRILIQRESDGSPRMIGFLLDNTSTDSNYLQNGIIPFLRQRAVTVDSIEELTGLDFFPNVDAKLQERLEDRVDWKGWPQTPPR